MFNAQKLDELELTTKSTQNAVSSGITFFCQFMVNYVLASFDIDNMVIGQITLDPCLMAIYANYLFLRCTDDSLIEEEDSKKMKRDSVRNYLGDICRFLGSMFPALKTILEERVSKLSHALLTKITNSCSKSGTIASEQSLPIDHTMLGLFGEHFYGLNTNNGHKARCLSNANFHSIGR